jgi:hypothetical protein
MLNIVSGLWFIYRKQAACFFQWLKSEVEIYVPFHTDRFRRCRVGNMMAICEHRGLSLFHFLALKFVSLVGGVLWNLVFGI